MSTEVTPEKRAAAQSLVDSLLVLFGYGIAIKMEEVDPQKAASAVQAIKVASSAEIIASASIPDDLGDSSKKAQILVILRAEQPGR